MARIRTIKPEFWADEKLAPLTPLDRLVFLGLISQADDAGRLVDSVRQLDGLLFPFSEDTCGPSLDKLADLERIQRYTSDSGQSLIQITRWENHQRVVNPSKHTLPGPSCYEQCPQRDTEPSLEPNEDLTRDEVDPKSPTMDHGPRTMEHGPGSRGGVVEEVEEDAPRSETQNSIPLESYLKARVPTDRRSAYRATVAMWMSGGRESVWRKPDGSRVPEEERAGLLDAALLDLAASDESTMSRPSGDPSNLQTKLNVLIGKEYDPPRQPRPRYNETPGADRTRSGPESTPVRISQIALPERDIRDGVRLEPFDS